MGLKSPTVVQVKSSIVYLDFRQLYGSALKVFIVKKDKQLERLKKKKKEAAKMDKTV